MLVEGHMRYDAQQDCYVGQLLQVSTAAFERAYATRVAAGQDPDVALEDLLDELSWSAWMPGVHLRPGRSTAVLPWVCRPVVAVVQADADTADRLQHGLEQAGYRAPAFVPGATQGLNALRAFLAPAPQGGVFSVASPRRWVWWQTLRRELPACRLVLTGRAPRHLWNRGGGGGAVLLEDAEEDDRLVDGVLAQLGALLPHSGRKLPHVRTAEEGRQGHAPRARSR